MEDALQTSEIKTDWEMAQAVGLSEKEWEHLLKQLERTPSLEELQMIGVQWSEHCSYKSSKRYLKKLITEGKAVYQGPGENAGLVRLDDRRLLAFKIESHNHPSYVEPFQGAATGVGGILRDIFTVGARPIALGNYLRFGSLEDSKHQYLLNGVVSGISHYGNCVGIPTLGGQIHIDVSYMGNILVNVFALGIVHKDEVFLSNSAKPGQSVMIWGAKTGRDGIHGASLLASADFDEAHTEKKEQKIRVQVGDPFKEKCVMEATLEAMASLKSKIGAIQDMGAAGLTCSTLEISDKSGVGMRIDLNKVPVREEKMQAFEILLSESQERMLACVEKGSEDEFQKILHRWECEAEVIGETTSDGLLKIKYHDEQIVNLPVSRLMDPPEADLPTPQSKLPLFSQSQNEMEVPLDVRDEASVLSTLLSEGRVASKAQVYERYDSSVGAATVWGPGEAEAAVLWVGDEHNQNLGVAFKGACDEALALKNPRAAAQYAMAECYRALACVGAEALAITDGVNLGNPKFEKVQTELSESVQGINDAIEVFETPCISGNVSLYNQSTSEEKTSDIKPSVFIVMVGKIRDVQKSRPNTFQKEGNEIWLLESGKNSQELPFGSLYARKFWNAESEIQETSPYLNLSDERKLAEALLEAHDSELFESIRDIGDGGLAVSLAEACFGLDHRFGFEGDWSKYQGRRDLLLFGEAGGRVIVEIDSSKRAELMKLGLKHRLELKRLGSLTRDQQFRIRPLLSTSIDALFKKWQGVFSAVV